MGKKKKGCSDICIGCDDYASDESFQETHWCYHGEYDEIHGRRIEEIGFIPEWCPLEDADKE